jgi:hypothetical protein
MQDMICGGLLVLLLISTLHRMINQGDVVQGGGICGSFPEMIPQRKEKKDIDTWIVTMYRNIMMIEFLFGHIPAGAWWWRNHEYKPAGGLR